jgi:site-specific recombinase XerD
VSKGKMTDSVWPVCACADPSACTRRAPHRTWSWRLTLPVNPLTGRRPRPSGSGLPTKSAAIIAYQSAATDYRSGRRTDDGGQTVARLMTWWLEQKRMRRPAYSPNTIANYETGAELWSELLGQIRLKDLEYKHINNALAYLGRRKDVSERPLGRHGQWKAQLTVSTLRRHQSVIRNALNYAMREGWVTKNVATGTMAAIGDSTAWDGAVDDDDAEWDQDIVEAIDIRWGPSDTATFLDTLIGHKWEALFTQYVYSAARRSEWLGASWKARKHGGLSVRWRCLVLRGKEKTAVCPSCKQEHYGRKLHPRTKSKRGERWIPLPREAQEVLDWHYLAQQDLKRRMGSAFNDHNLIFCEDDGTPIHPNQVSDEFERLVKAAGLPVIRLHDLRHNAASLFLAAGIPVEVVAKMTGHDVKVLRDVYHSLNPEMAGAQFQAANDTVTRLRGHCSALTA